MSRHRLSFAAATALAVVSSPAMGQDYEYKHYENEEDASSAHDYRASDYRPHEGYDAPHHRSPHYRPPHHGERAGHGDLPPMPHTQRLPGYSLAERDAWLDQCRASYYGYERDRTGRRREGGVIGGVLGAVTGGIIGNRVVDDERLGATLIGAGVGGLAGLAIGAAIDAATGDGGRDDYDRIDECEAYLLTWEADYERRLAYARPYGEHYGYGYAPVMMVKVPIMTERRHKHDHDADCTQEVVEEWIEEEVVQPTPTKTVRIKTVPTKTVPIKTTPVKTAPVKTRTIKPVK